MKARFHEHAAAAARSDKVLTVSASGCYAPGVGKPKRGVMAVERGGERHRLATGANVSRSDSGPSPRCL
jgi:hypothetical protein